MTLKELFLSVDFDRVWQMLLRHYPEMKNSGIGMKQSFDEIRLVKPKPDDADERIEVGVMHDDDRNYIRVMHCSNHYRCIVAGREIVIESGLNLSAEELSAHCLWELTFWGFSEEDRIECFRDHTSSWGISEPINKYWAEYQEKDGLWFPPVRLEDYTFKAGNRSKCKRDYRRMKRLRQLRRFAKIEELQQYIDTNNIDFNLWPVLMDCESFSAETDRSYAAAPEDAENYLCDLYSKYESENNEGDDNDLLTIVILTGGNKVKSDFHRLREAIEINHVNPHLLVGNREENQFTVKFITVRGAQNKP